ncbi:MAG: ankyrin repeat domain-containing protein [Chlamydiae bacterium]|nr:ankyrin repeat domain-containing protein [Chlamydiota bacterium]
MAVTAADFSLAFLAGAQQALQEKITKIQEKDLPRFQRPDENLPDNQRITEAACGILTVFRYLFRYLYLDDLIFFDPQYINPDLVFQKIQDGIKDFNILIAVLSDPYSDDTTLKTIVIWANNAQIKLSERPASCQDYLNRAASAAWRGGHPKTFNELKKAGAVIREDLNVSQEAFSLNAQKQKLNLELLDACKEGKLEKAQTAITLGANVDSMDLRDSENHTALGWAAEGGHTAIVQKLIAKGALNGHFAVNLAIKKGHTETVRAFIDSIANDIEKKVCRMNALIAACGMGKTKLALTLINDGANVNGFFNGTTALIEAAKYDQTNTVLALLNCNANVKTKDQFGYTALRYAKQDHYEETALALINEGRA